MLASDGGGMFGALRLMDEAHGDDGGSWNENFSNIGEHEA